jgi:hypothetical protein
MFAPKVCVLCRVLGMILLGLRKVLGMKPKIEQNELAMREAVLRSA